MSLEQLPLQSELLLLLLDEEGRVRVDTTKRRAAVAGAAVLQLIFDGVLDLGPGDRQHARLVAVPGAEPRSATLGQVRDRAVGRTLKAAIARTGGASDWKGRADQI